MEYFVECHDLFKIYEAEIAQMKVIALRGIDLSIRKNTLTAIMGHSGSGKSTLFNMFGGMEKPSAGYMRVDDYVLSTLNPEELSSYRKKIVSYIFQDPKRNLFWNLSLRKNIQIPMKIRGITLEVQKKRIKELSHIVGISHRLSHNPSKVSGGEAQRASLAVALAKNPKLILADEPTGELDSKNALKIGLLLQELKDCQDTTILVATHDNRIAKMCNSTYYIRDGRITGIELVRADNTKEYYVYVDKFGHIRLPDNFINILKSKSCVLVKQKTNNVNIIEIVNVGDLSE